MPALRERVHRMKGFTVFTEAWWAESQRPQEGAAEEIMVGDYDPDGGTTGEFAVRWYNLQGRLTPRVEMFHDSWQLFREWPEFFDALAHISYFSAQPEYFRVWLEAQGFKDMTPRENPYA